MRTDEPSEPRPVFVAVSQDVELSVQRVASRFLEEDGWLSPLATIAEREGALRARIGPLADGAAPARELRAEVKGMMPVPDAAVVWLQWRASRHTLLRPVLDGELRIVGRGPSASRITFSASYVPPLGRAGLGLDWAIMHRVAESALQRFLRELAGRLRTDLVLD